LVAIRKGFFLFHYLKLKIMKTIYRILKTIFPKNIFGIIHSQKTNFNLKRGELHSEANSLLAHMYSAENDNLFI